MEKTNHPIGAFFIMAELRPEQQKALNDVKNAYASGFRAPILCAPTGAGKTFMASKIISSAIKKGKRVWFLVHLNEILEDTATRLSQSGIDFGFIAAGRKMNMLKQVQLVSVQTAARRTFEIYPDLVIVDECHLAVASTYKKVLQSVGNPFLLGLTGTPRRLDGRGLNEMFDVIIKTQSTRDLIQSGRLAPIKYYAPYVPELKKIKITRGDYALDELKSAMDKTSVTGDTVKHYKEKCDGRRAVAFCVNIEHAQHAAEMFRASGYSAVAISGDSTKEERRSAMDGLRSGKIQVVCNCQLWVAGVDVPNIECVILLRPSKSLTFYLQAIGRGLRLANGKNCLTVLDHAGLIFEHGPPDMEREWSLEAKKKGSSAPPVRQCPKCFAAHAPAPVCPECGYVYEQKKRFSSDQPVDGELDEIDMRQAAALERLAKRKEMIAKKAEQGRAKTLEQLIELGRSRGYKHPVGWARKIMASRHF